MLLLAWVDAAVTVTGTATGDGTLTFMWGDRLRKVAVTNGQGQNAIAAAIKAADTLNGVDPNCANWIKMFREPAPEGAGGRGGRGGREGRRRRD